MDIQEIRRRVSNGKYLVKTHAIQHALKEGFEQKNIIEAVLSGKIIEDYFEEQRCLICGATNLTGKTKIYLHIVCDYFDEQYLEFVTAYIPDEISWEVPPFRRRK